jgi:hypothetical protein
MAKKKKYNALGPLVHVMHYQSSALIFLSLLAATAHRKVILPKR